MLNTLITKIDHIPIILDIISKTILDLSNLIGKIHTTIVQIHEISNKSDFREK